MRVLTLILARLFGLLALVSLLWIAFDDIVDVNLVWGTVAAVIALMALPMTVTFFPIILAACYHSWGQAISTYIILPIIWGLSRVFQSLEKNR